jgi:hypothetical protein
MTPSKIMHDHDEVYAELEESVRLPKWVIGIVVGILTMTSGAVLSWAVNVDATQRDLLQNVSGLQENREYVSSSLKRIESKVDQLLGIRNDTPLP